MSLKAEINSILTLTELRIQILILNYMEENMNDVKVISIPDDTRIIINVGFEDKNVDKLSLGQKVDIVCDGIKITDPDTKKSLGFYYPLIEQLEITEIYEKFSVARKIEEKKYKPFSAANIPPIFREEVRSEYKHLNIDESIFIDNKKYKNYISIGDKVRFV